MSLQEEASVSEQEKEQAIKEKEKRRIAYQQKRKKQAIRGLLVTAGILFGFFILLAYGKYVWGVVGYHMQYSEGQRIVKIIKVSEKGLLWRTWEVEGVVSQADGFATTYIWHFSIDTADINEDLLLQQVQQAFENGQTVKVRYEQKVGASPWHGETAYFVKEIRI